ncbi:MAG: hypothetical protein GY795_21850 [Desulfobacterales bacterium]|nr:hypothetical protein [Desulfobacterales bacterium]
MRICKIAVLFFFMILCFTVALKAEKSKNQQSKEWQVRGALAAFNDSTLKVQIRALDKLKELGALEHLSEEHRLR